MPLPFEYSATNRPRLNLDAACAQGRELDLKTELARSENHTTQTDGGASRNVDSCDSLEDVSAARI